MQLRRPQSDIPHTLYTFFVCYHIMANAKLTFEDILMICEKNVVSDGPSDTTVFTQRYTIIRLECVQNFKLATLSGMCQMEQGLEVNFAVINKE